MDTCRAHRSISRDLAALERGSLGAIPEDRLDRMLGLRLVAAVGAEKKGGSALFQTGRLYVEGRGPLPVWLWRLTLLLTRRSCCL